MTKAIAEQVTISAPNFQTAIMTIVGRAPLVMNRFSSKAKQQMRETQEAGSVAKKGKKREPKDFQGMYEGAKHISSDGWCGIPAAGFRSAMISACRLVGFQMTRAKLSFFIEADGFDKEDGIPLVKITKGKPEYFESCVRLETGVVDIHARPMWREGWEAIIRVRYDADQFSSADIANLLLRAGLQVGICEGRPDSKKSNGMGWGVFDIKEQK